MRITPRHFVRVGLLLIVLGLWPLFASMMTVVPLTRDYRLEMYGNPVQQSRIVSVAHQRRTSKMPEKIARGGTGQATLVEVSAPNYTNYTNARWQLGGVFSAPGPSIYGDCEGAAYGPCPGNPSGFVVQNDGTVTVPNDAATGIYTLYIFDLVQQTWAEYQYPDSGPGKKYEFEVVCMTVDVCYHLVGTTESGHLIYEVSATVDPPTSGCDFNWFVYGVGSVTGGQGAPTTTVTISPDNSIDQVGVDVTCGDCVVYGATPTQECEVPTSSTPPSSTPSSAPSSTPGGGGGSLPPWGNFPPPESSAGGFPTSWGVSSSDEGTSLPSSGTSLGGVPTSSGVSSSNEGTSLPQSGTSDVPTSSAISSSNEGTSLPQSDTSAGGIATSWGISSSNEGTSTPLSGTSTGGIATSAGVSSSGLGTSLALSGTSSEAPCIADAPLKPQPPVVTKEGCATAHIVTPAWRPSFSRATTYMKVERSFDGVNFTPLLTLYLSGATWNDIEPLLVGTVWYRVQACNALGCSPWSDAAQIALGSPITAEIIAPVDDVLRGIETITLRFSAVVDEAKLFYGGVELTPVQSLGDPKVYSAQVDTSADIWQGPVEISGYGIKSGCRTSLVSVVKTLNNTLTNSVMHEELTLEKERAIAGVEVSALFLPLDGVTDAYIELGVYNAPPASHPMGENPSDEKIAEAEEEWPYARKIRRATREKLLDQLMPDGTIQEPTDTVVLRLRKTPTWRPSRYPTTATATRFIEVSEGEVLVIALPKIYTLSAEDGWSEKYNLAHASLNLPGAVDVDFRADKIYAVENNRVVALDIPKDDTVLDFGTAHQIFSPVNETKPAKFVRYLPTGDMMAMVFSDDDNTTLYVLRADQSKEVVNFALPTTHISAAGKWLALGCDNVIRIYEGGTQAAPVRWTHSSPLTFVHVDKNKNLVFGDDRGDGWSDVYSLPANASTPHKIATRPFLTRAYAGFGGIQNDPLGAVGGDNPQLFQERVQGVNVLWNGTENFGDGAKIHALQRFTTESGGMTFENLLIAVEHPTGHFVARLEKAVKPPLAYEASGNVPYVVFAATSYK